MQPVDVLNALQGALEGALDNISDSLDGSMPAATGVECCADIAALGHLLGNDATGNPRLLAYLPLGESYVGAG